MAAYGVRRIQAVEVGLQECCSSDMGRVRGEGVRGEADMFVPGLLPPSFLLLPPSALARAGERGGERDRERSLMIVAGESTVN